MSKVVEPGMTVLINGVGDFAFDGEAKRHFIGKKVKVIQKCKSGLYLVENDEGKRKPIAKYNITILDEVDE